MKPRKEKAGLEERTLRAHLITIYVVTIAGILAAMLAVVVILALFLYAVRQQSNRTLDLVASEYP